MNLKVFLATYNLKVNEFARMLDISPSYLSSVISGNFIPSNKLIRSIEKATGGEVKFNIEHRARKRGATLKKPNEI